MKKRLTFALLGLAILFLFACLGLAWVAATTGDSRLLSIDGIESATTQCLNAKNIVRSGLQFKLRTTWLAEKDLVGVIDDYAAFGYRPIDNYTTSLKMLPAAPQTFELLVAQARMQRAISLAYTPNFSTEIQAITTLTLCLP